MSSVVVDQIEENWSMVDQPFIDEISQIGGSCMIVPQSHG